MSDIHSHPRKFGGLAVDLREDAPGLPDLNSRVVHRPPLADELIVQRRRALRFPDVSIVETLPVCIPQGRERVGSVRARERRVEWSSCDTLKYSAILL
jgi:hypothetical protein